MSVPDPSFTSTASRGHQDSVLAQGLNTLGIWSHAGSNRSDRLLVTKPGSPRREAASGKLLSELA